MKRIFPLLPVVMVVGSACAAFIVLGGLGGGSHTAYAYAIPSGGQLPVPPALQATGSLQGYNFGTSFGNLISPFTNFFNSITPGNVAPVTFNVAGTGTGTANVTIGVNLQPYIAQYINQFDAWFYNVSGVHIQWLLVAIANIFAWFFSVINGIVQWMTGAFHH